MSSQALTSQSAGNVSLMLFCVRRHAWLQCHPRVLSACTPCLALGLLINISCRRRNRRLGLGMLHACAVGLSGAVFGLIVVSIESAPADISAEA